MNKKNSNKKNQRSFYFNEYNQDTLKKKIIGPYEIDQDRIYLLFFIFFCLIFIFSLKIFFISLKNYDPKHYLKNHNSFEVLRNDILDRNGDYIARSIPVYHVAIKPDLIKDKKKFIIKLKLIDSKLNYKNIKSKLNQN